ncbi:MAG TPA: TonB-dependent receptor [Opitutaceae bacterium]|nr:TonB-dependent receptor [Opitutaceae bacterium]
MRAAKATALSRRGLAALSRLFVAVAAALSLTAAPLLRAQMAGGTVIGQVYNPATKEYVRNAEVRVDGSDIVAVTGDGGFFRLTGVPAGEATVTVSYVGYPAQSQKVNVTAGETATRDFELTAQGAQQASGDAIQLEAYVVSSEREGNSKAIASQKRNMNVTTSVASDIFGDVTDGNIGEFLKYLPGVDVDYVESETRGPRLGGMDAQYVGVSFDGVRLASADANRTGDLGGATSFEAFSISSVESIEIHRTTSSDMDADSPAGTINLKTRRAFDRKGRRIGYNFSVNLNSEEFTWDKTYGPAGNERLKMRPNYSLEYSDSFLNNRLGIVASMSHADSYTEQYRHNMTYNFTTTATDTRPQVITALNFKDGAKNIVKDTYTVTADFKATERLVLSTTYIYNFALGQFFNREFTFNTGGRSSSVGDGVNNVRTNGTASGRNSAIGGGSASKKTHTVTIFPRFELKLDNWTFDGGMSYSRSFNNYEALEEGHARSTDVNSIVSDWNATRANHDSYEWTIQQTAGPDWFNLANRTNPRITNEGRMARTELWSGDLNARWVVPGLKMPTVLKFGGKWAEDNRNNTNETSALTYSYIGPGGNILNPNGTITTTGSFAGYVLPTDWSTGKSNILTVKDLQGNVRPSGIPRPDDTYLAQLFAEHPEYFVNTMSADNYYNAFIAPHRRMTRTVTAAYTMADVRVNPKIAVRAGVRWEDTESEFKEPNARTSDEVRAAGFAVSNGRATTIPGLFYQFQERPRTTRVSSYDNLFPMVSVKYDITDRLQFHTGFNKAISRPPVDHLTGAWIVNDDIGLITAPNPNLLPEYSKNFAARLAYYFEPAGQLSVTVTQNNIRNLREERTGTAEEFGLGDDPVYGGYDFRTRFNVANPVRFRNLEVAWGQTLPFSSELLRNITLNMAYSRSYASQRRNNLLPHRFTTSLGWRYKKFSTRLGFVWRDDTDDTSDTNNRFRRHDAKLDWGGEYRINSKVSLYWQGRNIFNGGQTWMQGPRDLEQGEAAAVRVYENYGANWNFGVKGTF